MTTIFGWDMSHYDRPGIGNAIDQGIAFVTHKAGGDQTDPDLAAWWSGVKDDAVAGRVLAGAYWVLYPGHPAARADEFLARLDAACPGWRDVPFILQADCEKWNGDPGTVPSRGEIQAFCAMLAARMPKLRPVVYAPHWVYGDSLTGLGYPLWASTYVSGAGGFRALYPGDTSARWAPYSGQTPAILQYSSSAVIGGQTTSDANAFRGTLAQLTALVAPGWSDDVNVDGLINDTSTDKIPETPVGHWVLSQGIPDGTNGGKRTPAWQVIENLGAKVLELEQKVAAIGTPDPAVLAQAIAAAIPADLAGKVADVLAQRLTS